MSTGKPDAAELAETLDNLLASIPPRNSREHEREAWEQAQDEAQAVLDRYRAGGGE